MPFCPQCGKEVLPTDRFCLNCGQPLERAAVGAAPVRQVVMQAPGPPPMAQVPSQPGSKSPAAAAILNFFFPGIGYVYNGIGRDTGELIFGVLVFIFYFVGLEVGIVAVGLTETGTTTGTLYSPFSALILLAYLLPFAFAYDGYRRAKFG